MIDEPSAFVDALLLPVPDDVNPESAAFAIRALKGAVSLRDRQWARAVVLAFTDICPGSDVEILSDALEVSIKLIADAADALLLEGKLTTEPS